MDCGELRCCFVVSFFLLGVAREFPLVECVGTCDYAKPSLVSFVLRGSSLQLDFVWSRHVNYCFDSFYFYFCSKMVSVVTFRVKLRENSLVLM
jgi:hypothetical protein